MMMIAIILIITMIITVIIIMIIILITLGDSLASSEAARLLPLQINSQEEVSCSHHKLFSPQVVLISHCSYHKLFSPQQYVVTINIVAPIAICIGGSLIIISKPKSNGVEEIGI